MPHKVLISSCEFGIGKSVLALAYSQVLGSDKELLSCDYEDGQEYYVVPTREQADPSKCLFYARRLKAPSVYELQAIVQRIIHPDLSRDDLRIKHQKIDPSKLSKPVRAVMADIAAGKLKIGGIAIDTATRLCELYAESFFGPLVETRGLDYAEKMSRLTWQKVKDDLSELFYNIIDEAGIALIMTAWSKNEFDRRSMKNTGEIVTDVLKNVHAFMALELMLEPNPDSRVRVPRARVTKSRLVSLPRDFVLERATWDEILAKEPKFLRAQEALPEDKETAA